MHSSCFENLADIDIGNWISKGLLFCSWRCFISHQGGPIQSTGNWNVFNNSKKKSPVVFFFLFFFNHVLDYWEFTPACSTGLPMKCYIKREVFKKVLKEFSIDLQIKQSKENPFCPMQNIENPVSVWSIWLLCFF